MQHIIKLTTFHRYTQETLQLENTTRLVWYLNNLANLHKRTG